MVELWCAISGLRRSVFAVTIDANACIDDLKEVIKAATPSRITCGAADLELYLAKKGETWLTENDVRDGVSTTGLRSLQNVRVTLRSVGLTDESVESNVTDDALAAGDGPVNIIVWIPPRVEATHLQEPPSQLSPFGRLMKHSRADFGEQIKIIRDKIQRLREWTVGWYTLGINAIEPDFPEHFYVRQEIVDIIKVFFAQRTAGNNVVLLGTPGVGKSMLVVLIAFYMALIEGKRVVLFRLVRQRGCSILHLNPQDRLVDDIGRGRYRRFHDARGLDTLKYFDVKKDCELCLDGLVQKDIKSHMGLVATFRLLAAAVQYELKSNDLYLKPCLVPFWSLKDLTIVGHRMEPPRTDADSKNQYFISGGSLPEFLKSPTDAMDTVCNAITRVDPNTAALLSTQYGWGHSEQIDRIRMVALGRTMQEELQWLDLQRLDLYVTEFTWVCVITSEYALKQLGEIVKPSYFEELWKTACDLQDDGLIDIAFENYVHARAREGKTIKLQVRTYDPGRRQKDYKPCYESWVLVPDAPICSGDNEPDCLQEMKCVSRSERGYWYPVTRCLEAIDCVAKLHVGDEVKVGLIQITQSSKHNLICDAIASYVKELGGNSVYVALVPDRTTCDAFRFEPVDPGTKTSLYVAYMEDSKLVTTQP